MTPLARRFIALALVLLVATPPDAVPQSRLELTVDGIMRGPRLVGHPPEELRWSGDSRELFFEWRLGTEDEAATWVVTPGGKAPRRLTDAERRLAPAASGRWAICGCCAPARAAIFWSRGRISSTWR